MLESLPERIILAGQLYLSGLSTTDVAPLLGVSKSMAAVYVARSGVKIDKAARISNKAKGRTSPRKGKTHTDSAKQKMSAARKGKTPTLGTKRTEAQKQKMRDVWHSHRLNTVFLSKEEKAAREKTRNACKRMLRRVLTMSRSRKNLPTEKLLGFSKEQLRNHLQSQFKAGMSWSERESFHIDHIKPVAVFFQEGIYDPAVINALSNLQVLTPDENRQKSDKYVPGIVA